MQFILRVLSGRLSSLLALTLALNSWAKLLVLTQELSHESLMIRFTLNHINSGFAR